MQKLGQHFLTNRRVLEKIAAVLCVKSNNTIIEIGPGHGELTFLLAQTKAKIIAIEKDNHLVKNLESRIQNLGLKNVKIIEGDILKILPRIPKFYILNSKSLKLVGNIPYYITGYLLRIISELKNKPELIVLTIQKEVAERIISRPPKMNLLAASVQFWAKPEIIDFIPKKDFQPEPKIDSAIIKLTPKQQIENRKLKIERDCFYKLIKVLFKQPRKTILNNLREGGWNKEKITEICEKLEINPALRPQNLSLEQIKRLASML